MLTVRTELRKKGHIINKKRINRIMKENGLMSKKACKFKAATTDSAHGLRKYPNLTKDLKAKTVNRLIVGDVSQFCSRGKDYFIATLMDVCSREIVGWSVSSKNDTELVLSALEDAVKNRGSASLRNCIHHTDSDVRYCSDAYIKKLKSLKMKISMCVGNSYENAYAESLFKTIKYQELNISEYRSETDMVNKLFQYIDKYNVRRPHSALGGMSPLEYRNFLLKKQKKI